MPKLATSARNRPWSEGAIRALKNASKKRTKVTSLSNTLKRSHTALRQKARELGIGLGEHQWQRKAKTKKAKARA